MINKFVCFAKTIIMNIRFLNCRICIHYSSKISKKCQVRIFPRGSGSIKIGAGCRIHDYAMLLTYKGNITIGNNCTVNPFSILYGHGGLTIGNGVRIAAHCVFIPANHNFSNVELPIYQQGYNQRGIVIEDDVWIGANCTILDGVIIGKGCVIGAGTVVTKSIDPYSVAVGVPARVIKKRV